MPGAVTLRLKGDKKLRKALQKVDTQVRKRAQAAAVVSGALLVANDAKRKAPILTGTLRRSIHVGGHGDRTPDFKPGADQAPYSQLDGLEERGSAVIALIGTDLDYATYQELGTSRMPAHPFLRPALDQNVEAVQQEMAEVVWQVIKRAAR